MERELKLELKTCVGIGDLIFIYSYAEQVKHIYSEIKICPEYSILSAYRSGSKESYDFSKKFVAFLFSEPYYILGEHCNSKPLTLSWDLFNSDIKAQYVDLRSKLCLPEKIDIGTDNYIVINTKIRDFDIRFWNKTKNDFFKILRSTSKKIVLMGERRIGINKEQNIYTIYDDLKDALYGIDHLDFTKEVILDYPNFDELRRDLTIIRDAKASINFGASGMAVLSPTVADVSIGYRLDNYTFFDDFLLGINKNSLVTNNIEDFLRFTSGICL